MILQNVVKLPKQQWFEHCLSNSSIYFTYTYNGNKKASYRKLLLKNCPSIQTSVSATTTTTKKAFKTAFLHDAKNFSHSAITMTCFNDYVHNFEKKILIHFQMDECLEWKELCGESRLRLRSVCHHSWSEWPQWRHHRRENWCRKLDQVRLVSYSLAATQTNIPTGRWYKVKEC